MEPTDSPFARHLPPKSLAEARRLFRRTADVDSSLSPMAIWLAATLAERLETILPPPFHVRAEGGWVSYFNGDDWDGSSDIAGVLDQDSSAANADSDQHDETPPVDRVASICWNVLSSAQDMISETTREPWPRLPHGGMANPGTRAEGGLVYLWYGPDAERDDTAVLSLSPIELGTWGK
jgi:hypothetical protein